MPTTIHNIIATQAKIENIKNNSKQLHVVADFDATLTQYFDQEGKTRPSIISILRDEWVLGPEYTKAANELYHKHGPVEYNMEMSFADRCASNIERWTKHKKLLQHFRLHQKHIDQLIDLDKIVMRVGTDVLLQNAYAKDIPVLIFSASGIGINAIHKLLEKRWLYLPNIYIISNEIYRDQDGYMSGYSTPTIHSLNKLESVIRDNPEYQVLQDILKPRPHAIVLWDSLGDAQMVEDRPDRTVLRIGFCNHKVAERLPYFQEVFDIIVTNDDSRKEINTMLFT